MKIQKTSLKKSIKNKTVRNKSKIMHKKIYRGGEPPIYNPEYQECLDRLRQIHQFRDSLDEVSDSLDANDKKALRLLCFLDEFDLKRECEEAFRYHLDLQNYELDTTLQELESRLTPLLAQKRAIHRKRQRSTPGDNDKVRMAINYAPVLRQLQDRITYLEGIIKDDNTRPRTADWDGKPIFARQLEPNAENELELSKKRYARLMSDNPEVDPFEASDAQRQYYELCQHVIDLEDEIFEIRKLKRELIKIYKDGRMRAAIGIINNWANEFKSEVFNLSPEQTLIELRSERSLSAPQIMQMILQFE
jgi:hypothetical protein